MLKSEIATLAGSAMSRRIARASSFASRGAGELSLHLQRDRRVVAGAGEAAAVADLAMNAGRFLVVRDGAAQIAEVEQDVADVVQRDRQVDAVANLTANRQRLAIERQRAR